MKSNHVFASLLLAVLSIGGAGSAIAAPFLLVSKVQSGTVSVIDVATNSVASTVPIAASALLGIAVAPDGAFAYVGGFSGTVWVIDTAAGVVVDAIPVGAGPREFAFTQDSALAYVVDQYADVVWVIDTASSTVVDSLDLPVTDPYSAYVSIAIAPDDSRVYIVYNAGDSRPSTLLVVDPSANRVVATIPVGGYASEVALSPDGALAYVVNQCSSAVGCGSISVVDTSSGTVTGTIPTGQRASQSIAITQDGRRGYVSNTASNTVSVIDLATRHVVGAPIPVGIQPHQLVITPDQKFVYVAQSSCRGGCLPPDYYGSVAVIETATNTVVATIPVGGVSPSWLAIAPTFTAVPTPECADSVDNDGDGGFDWGGDPGCDSPADESERSAALVCDDGIDNDGDGHIDYPDDPGCTSSSGTIENPQCEDGIDNDGDGHIDYPDDPGCSSVLENDENGGACDDNVDNDGDARTDFPLDPGCTDLSDASELVLFADGGSHILDGSSAPLEDTVLVAALVVLGYHFTYYDPTEVRLDEGGAIPSDLQISRSTFEMTGGSVGGDITVSDCSWYDVGLAPCLELGGGIVGGDVRVEAWTSPEAGAPNLLVSGSTILGALELRGADSWGGVEAEIVSGAVTGDIDVWDASRLVLQGGLLSGTLRAHDQSVVEIHGSGFNFPNGAMTAVAGTLTGTFADGTPLSLPFARDAEATIMLPEPSVSAMCLAGVLGLSLCRRWRLRRK